MWRSNLGSLDPHVLGGLHPQVVLLPSPLPTVMPRLKGAKSPVYSHPGVLLWPLQVGFRCLKGPRVLCKRLFFLRRKGLWDGEEVRLSPHRRVFPLWERALLQQPSFYGQSSLMPKAELRRQGVIRPQWYPNSLKGHTQGRWIPALAEVLVMGRVQAAREGEAQTGTHFY